MQKLLICAALISLAGAVHAASCIVSGSVIRVCASEAYAMVGTMESVATDEGFARLPSLEARCGAEQFSVLSQFNSERRFAGVICIR